VREGFGAQAPCHTSFSLLFHLFNGFQKLFFLYWSFGLPLKCYCYLALIMHFFLCQLNKKVNFESNCEKKCNNLHDTSAGVKLDMMDGG
jgi:hypothetical protein